MVVRDRDVLAELSRVASCTVYMSVPTVDEDAWRMLEPGTAHPLQRLRAVRELVDAGVNAGVLMAPIVPGFSSSRSKLERTIKAIADHGARFVGCNVMYLQDGTRTHFMQFIEREFPSMRAAVRAAVREEISAGRAIARRCKAMVRVLQERYGLRRRDATTRARSAAATGSGGRQAVAGSGPKQSRGLHAGDLSRRTRQATSPNASIWSAARASWPAPARPRARRPSASPRSATPRASAR